MKKLLALLLVLSSLFALASCTSPEDEEATSEGFIFEPVSDGYAIVGLTEEAKTAKTLEIPLEYEGKGVIVIAANAFGGSAVEKIIITEDTNIRKLENGAFAGASHLSALYIYQPDEKSILPPDNFTGTHKDFTIYVPEGSYYDTGYFWTKFADMIEFIGE